MTADRRTVFAGSAALAVAMALPAAAQPAAPAPAAQAAIPQAPGFYRFKVGAWTVTQVHDGFFRRPVEGFVRNAALPEVQAILADSFMPVDMLTIPFTITFAQRGEALVVFDAGNGVTPAGATQGRMIAHMEAAGIDTASWQSADVPASLAGAWVNAFGASVVWGVLGLALASVTALISASEGSATFFFSFTMS